MANSTHKELVQTNGDALWTFLRDKEQYRTANFSSNSLTSM